MGDCDYGPQSLTRSIQWVPGGGVLLSAEQKTLYDLEILEMRRSLLVGGGAETWLGDTSGAKQATKERSNTGFVRDDDSDRLTGRQPYNTR